jgi:hypothetical protein
MQALYHLGYEQNRISVIQALLLMSLWYSTPDDQMDAHHWLSIAIKLAHRASLNRNPASMAIPDEEKHLRKRIWWCCLIRDPLLALGLKRPILITPEEHDVPPLALEDFELENMPKSLKTLGNLGITWDLSKLRLVRLTCIAEAKLHQCLSQIMSKQYAERDHHHPNRPTNPRVTSAILLPLTSDKAWQSLIECEESLREWREKLPPELNWPGLSPETADGGFDPAHVFQTTIHMVYHTSIIMMYRPWLKPARELTRLGMGASSPAFQSKIQAAIRMSARRITDLAIDLHKADIARHLPQTGLSAMAAAAVTHISDTASDDPSIRECALQGFENCFHILNELRENYYSADFTSDFLGFLAKARSFAGDVSSQMTRASFAQSVDLDEQGPAQKRFFAAEEIPDSTRTEPQPSASLPTALASEGEIMDGSVAAEKLNYTIEGLGDTLNNQGFATGEVPSWINSPEAGVEMGSLGDFFDDYRFSLFNVLPGIDLAG